MSLQERGQLFAAAPEHIAGALQSTSRGSDRLTVAQVNERFLHYGGQHWRLSVYRWLKAHGVNTGRRSTRCLLIKQADLERALSGRPSRHQHGAV